MSNSPLAKCCCESCGVHLEFPLAAAGTRIACPNCGQETELGALPLEPAANGPMGGIAPFTVADICAAFTGRVRPTVASFFYQFGLLFVTAAMILSLLGKAVLGKCSKP